MTQGGELVYLVYKIETIGSEDEEKSKSKLGSHVRVPSRLLGGNLTSRKSRSSEFSVGHDWFELVSLSEKGLNLIN